jgi:MFS family permease/rhodanese-related sulfurtransferase
MAELTRRYHIPSALRRSPFRLDGPAACEMVDGGALLVDVRRQHDPDSALERAVRIPPDGIPRAADALPRDVPIVLACTCAREATSVRVAYWLRDRGFEAYAVRGGVRALLGEPLPPAGADAGARRRPGLSLAALRHARFRRFAAASLLSQTGSWIEWAAFGYVALLLGGSVAALGVIGFLCTIPNLVVGLPAGALIDRFDRRRLLIATQVASMALSALLAVLWATDALTVELMGVLAVAAGSVNVLAFPAFHGTLASTVPRTDLESAVALNSLVLQSARFIGPAIGGIVLAAAGPAWVFAINAASYLALIVTVALLPRPSGPRRAREKLRTAMRAGFEYVLASRSMSSLLGLSALTGLFAVPPVMYMLPAIVRDRLQAGPETLGALTSAVGLGSLLGAATLLVLARRANKGEPILAAYAAAAVAVLVVAVSASTVLWVALVVGGLAGTVLAGLSTVVVQAASSDEMRARAIAIWALASAGAVPLGAVLTGTLANAFGVETALLVNGVALVGGGTLILTRRPEVRWLGCTTIPTQCVAATDPRGVALHTAHNRPASEPAGAAA